MRANWVRCDLESCADRGRLFLAVEKALEMPGVEAYEVEAPETTLEAAWTAYLCWRANCTAKLDMVDRIPCWVRANSRRFWRIRELVQANECLSGCVQGGNDDLDAVENACGDRDSNDELS